MGAWMIMVVGNTDRQMDSETIGYMDGRTFVCLTVFPIPMDEWTVRWAD